MKRADIIKLIGICSANYRNWPEDGKEEATVILWMKMFGDTEAFILEAAVEKYLADGKFPPTIADIRSCIADITVFREKTAIEAWGDVQTAIRKFGWYREKEAMQSLGGVTNKVIDSMGFKTVCISENETADRAHFLKVYDVLAERERQAAMMLQSTKDAMERLESGEGLIRRIK